MGYYYDLVLNYLSARKIQIGVFRILSEYMHAHNTPN